MILVRRRYRHPAGLDIDLDVEGILGEDETGVTCIVRYWNRHMKLYQGKHDVVKIKTQDIDRWQEVPRDN